MRKKSLFREGGSSMNQRGLDLDEKVRSFLRSLLETTKDVNQSELWHVVLSATTYSLELAYLDSVWTHTKRARKKQKRKAK